MSKDGEWQRTDSPVLSQSIAQAGAKGPGKKGQLLGGGGKGKGHRQLKGQLLSFTESPVSFWCILGCTAQQPAKLSTPYPRDVTVLQAEGAKPRRLFPYFRFWSSIVHSDHSGPLSYTGYLSGWRLPPSNSGHAPSSMELG